MARKEGGEENGMIFWGFVQGNGDGSEGWKFVGGRKGGFGYRGVDGGMAGDWKIDVDGNWR